ncbi:hypothetical protein ACF1AE_25530 [Streptomyces sp. NPDC014986]|uniref:hypothetical protein n=1 Tax=Streptomyces sp. NPDC014986 TaxID=3364934 RepID=UPI003700E8CB
MADYTSETVIRTIRRWVVPATEPWGAASDEIGKAWTAAQVAYREEYGIPVGTALPGDALWFHVRDEEIVIEFAVERQDGAPAEHCIHDRAIHTAHHHQPVTGCPWCASREEQP